MSGPVPPQDLLDEDVGAMRAMRAKARRWAVTIGANVALLALMVGGPYLRGHVRTRSLWPRFAEAAGCVLGAQPLPDGGLGLPNGNREAFAAQLMKAEAGWPARCTPALRALELPPAIFLLPAVKTAELDLDASVQIVIDELARVAERTPGTRVPERPLLALETLRAALARHAQAAGVVSIPDEDAVTLPAVDELPSAARVPLYAASDAELLWRADSRKLTALALDRRGLSFVEVQGGGLIERRDSRPRTLRMVVGDLPDAVSLVWAMRPTTCDDRDDACATKSVGVAALSLPMDGVPDPRWLATHPAGRADRNVFRTGERVRVLGVVRDEASVQVREFDLAAAPPTAESEESIAPLAAVSEWPVLRGASDGLLLGETGVLAHAVDVGAGEGEGKQSQFWFQGPGQAPQALGTLAGEGAWSLACEGGRAGAIGTLERVQLFRLPEGASEPVLETSLHVPLGAAVHAEWPGRDRVRVVCTREGQPLWVARAKDDHLVLVRCREDGCNKELLASQVQFFDIAMHGDDLVVAYAGEGARAQVMTRVVTLGDEIGLSEPVAPDPCWEGGGGMCGLPRLTQAGDRMLVAAREGTDMRVMESHDGGLHWTPMRGLRKASAP